MENSSSNRQPTPPPGYPAAAEQQPQQQGGGRKARANHRARGGDKSFIEGCIAALCCCWIFEMCCD